MGKSFEICQDRDGYPIGVNFFVKVERENRKGWRGWVEGYRSEYDRLEVRDSKRAHLILVDPANARVIPPSAIDKARRIGHQKQIRETSESARRARRVQSGRRTG